MYNNIVSNPVSGITKKLTEFFNISWSSFDLLNGPQIALFCWQSNDLWLGLIFSTFTLFSCLKCLKQLIDDWLKQQASKLAVCQNKSILSEGGNIIYSNNQNIHTLKEV